MATAVRNARDALRSRADELGKVLDKIKVWKKKAAQLDKLKKKKTKKKRKVKRRGGR